MSRESRAAVPYSADGSRAEEASRPAAFQTLTAMWTRSLALLAFAAHAASAQAPLTWETVGDRPIGAENLVFDAEGALWATSRIGVARLVDRGSPGATWDPRRDWPYDAIRPLGPDTVLTTFGSSTLRSTDGGYTFAVVHDLGQSAYGGQALAEDERGTLYVATNLGAARSTDRGATWIDAEVDTTHSRWGWAVLPLPDSVAAGRVVVGGLNGVSLADGDAPWALRPSAMWEYLRYGIGGLVLVARPGGGTRVVAIGYDSTLPHHRVWTSDDHGETWTERGGLPDIEDGGISGFATLIAAKRSSALVVTGRGQVYRSDDGGEGWQVAGRVPVPSTLFWTSSAALGPDGRLYAGLQRGGPSSDGTWVYRTTAPVVVASDAAPAPDGARVTVRPNPLASGAAVSVVLDADASVTATVYDALGRAVAVLLDGPLGAGRHEAALDGSALAPGVYVVRVAVRPVQGGPARVTVRRLTVAR